MYVLGLPLNPNLEPEILCIQAHSRYLVTKIGEKGELKEFVCSLA
jgi:hypothetical protein